MRRAIMSIAAAVAAISAQAMPTISSDSGSEGWMEVPERLVADPGVIPGSADFYEDLLIPMYPVFSARTNGIPAEGRTTTSIVKRTGDDYPYAAAVDSRSLLAAIGLSPDGDRDAEFPWRPELFDFAVSSGVYHVRFTMTGITDGLTPLYSVIGKELYAPRALRLTPATYESMRSSYAAYFERLYYGSQCEYPDYFGPPEWDEETLGPQEPGPEFRFNIDDPYYPSSGYFDFMSNGVRSVEDSLRLTDREAKRFAGLRDALFDGSAFAALRVAPDANVQGGMFLCRPASIAEGSDMISGRHNDRLVWWSSTADPPAHETGRQHPKTRGFGFMPSFDWTDDPAHALGDGAWPCRCVTFDMAVSSGGSGPVAEVFRLVGYSGPEFAFPFEFPSKKAGFLDWMTNAYPYCVLRFYDQEKAYERYVEECWGTKGEDPPLRLLPNSFVGVNQALGAADRTYAVPGLCFSSYFDEYEVDRGPADYSGSGSISIRLEHGESGGSYRAVFTQPSGTMTLSGGSGAETSVRLVGHGSAKDSVVLYASYPSAVANGSMTIDGYDFTPVNLDTETFEAHFSSWRGTHVAELVDSSGTAFPPSITVSYMVDGVSGPVHGGVPVNITDYSRTVEATISAFMSRSYSYTDTIGCGECLLGSVQGTGTAGGKVASCRAAFVSGMEIDYEKDDESFSETAFMSQVLGGSNLARNDIVGELDDFVAGLDDTIADYVAGGSAGADPHEPDSWAPIPSSVTAKWSVPGDIDANVVVEGHVDGRSRTFTNNVYRYWFNTSSNVTTKVMEWEHAVSNYLQVVKYYYADRYLEGEVVVREIRDGGIYYEPFWEDYIALRDDTVTESHSFEFKAGPFDSPQEKVSVPRYYATNMTDVVIGGQSSPTLYESEYNLDIWFTDVYTGSGPDDPGEFVRTDYDEYVGEPGPFHRHESGVAETNKFSESYVVHEELSVDDAVRKTGGEVFEASSNPFITFTMSDGKLSGEPTVEYRFANPYEGTVITEPGSFPLDVGHVQLNIGSADVTLEDVDAGGAQYGVDAEARVKVVTQTDWAWEYLRREDH